MAGKDPLLGVLSIFNKKITTNTQGVEKNIAQAKKQGGKTMDKDLSLPIDIKPFRVRTQEAWAAFQAGEGELRALMDQRDRAAGSEQLVALCSKLLAPAFANPAFELGYNGEKYELILTPQGEQARLFQLTYFQKRVPKKLLDKWNILVGRARSNHFTLRMGGQEVALEDVRAWVEKTADNGLGLRLYCEKLAALKREAEDQRYSILCILLDQALGELAAMRYVDYLDILDAPEAGESIRLDRLADYVAAEIDPEGWAYSDDPERVCERYIAYRGEPSREEHWPLRMDVYAGVTRCLPILRGYFQEDTYWMDCLHQDGAVPGFFYYPLDQVDRKDILDLRDQLENAVLGLAGADAVTFTGGATGTTLGYLDFIAWDLKALLDGAVKAFDTVPVARAAFHAFRADANGIILKTPREGMTR